MTSPSFERQSKPRHLLVVLLEVVLISVRTDEHDLKRLSRRLQRIVRVHQLGSETTAGATPRIWITAQRQRCVPSTKRQHLQHRRVVATWRLVIRQEASGTSHTGRIRAGKTKVHERREGGTLLKAIDSYIAPRA